MKIIRLNNILTITFFVLFFYQTIALAALDASISINQNETIDIDLTENITELNAVSITADNPTEQLGTTAPLPNNTITYTPPSPTFVGTDKFNYYVFDINGTQLGFGTVSVNVGLTAKAISLQGTPSDAVNTVLNGICITNIGTPVAPALVDICNDFTLASGAELENLIRALAPLELGGQNQLSASLASQQIDNIRKRLASLRQGIRGINTSQLSINVNHDKSIAYDDLFRQEDRGGAASANSNTSRLGVFVSGSVGGGDHNVSESEDGYSLNTRGLSFGTDYRFDDKTVAGAALGVNSSGMDIDDNGGDLTVNGFSTIGYGSYYINPKAYLEAIVAAYKNTFEASRIVEYDILGVTKTSTATSETNNGLLSVSVGGGYEIFYNKGLTINLSGNLDYIKTAFDGYAEANAAGANLTIEKREETQFTASANVQITYVINQATGVFIPQFDLALKHELEQDASIIEGHFTNDPDATNFEFSTEDPDTDYLKASFGFSYIVPGGNTGFMTYEKTLGRSDFSDYNISVGLRIEL